MNWRLRRATAADAPAVALVAAATFLDTFAGILAGEDIVAHLGNKSSAARFACWAEDPASILTIAEHPTGHAPVGYTLLTDPEDVGTVAPGDVELRRIYTMPCARGTGLGAALIARAVEDARALDATRLVLGVLAANKRACDFYERQGFRVTGERRFLVGATWNHDRVYARPV